MNKPVKSLRTVLIIGAALALMLLVVWLGKYESLASSILAWIDQFKAGR